MDPRERRAVAISAGSLTAGHSLRKAALQNGSHEDLGPVAHHSTSQPHLELCQSHEVLQKRNHPHDVDQRSRFGTYQCTHHSSKETAGVQRMPPPKECAYHKAGRSEQLRSARAQHTLTVVVDCNSGETSLSETHRTQRPLPLPILFSDSSAASHRLGFSRATEQPDESLPTTAPWNQQRLEEALLADVADVKDLERTAGGHTCDTSGPGDGVLARAQYLQQTRPLWQLRMIIRRASGSSMMGHFFRYCASYDRVQLALQAAYRRWQNVRAVPGREPTHLELLASQAEGVGRLGVFMRLLSTDHSPRNQPTASTTLGKTVAGASYRGKSLGVASSTVGVTGRTVPESRLGGRNDGMTASTRFLEDMMVHDKPSILSVLDMVGWTLTHAPARPLDAEELRQTLHVVCIQLYDEMNLMEQLMVRCSELEGRTPVMFLPRPNSATASDYKAGSNACFVATNSNDMAATERERGRVQLSLLPSPTDVDMLVRLISVVHHTGVPILTVEHVVEAVAALLATRAAPMLLVPNTDHHDGSVVPQDAGPLTEGSGMKNLFPPDVPSPPIIPLTPPKGGESGRIRSGGKCGGERGQSTQFEEENPAQMNPQLDLAFAIFSLDVLAQEPGQRQVCRDLAFSLHEVAEMLHFALTLCQGRYDEARLYTQRTVQKSCIDDLPPEQPKNSSSCGIQSVKGRMCQQSTELLAYLQEADVRLIHINSLYALLREKAPDLHCLLRQQHSVYLTGRREYPLRGVSVGPHSTPQRSGVLCSGLKTSADATGDRYVCSQVQRMYSKNFFVMAVGYECVAQLRDRERLVAWRDPLGVGTPLKSQRVGLTEPHLHILRPTDTPGYHLNEPIHPLSLPKCPPAEELLAWLRETVQKPPNEDTRCGSSNNKNRITELPCHYPKWQFGDPAINSATIFSVVGDAFLVPCPERQLLLAPTRDSPTPPRPLH